MVADKAFKKIQIPNPVHHLPLYFDDPEVKALDALLLRQATTEEEVTANELRKLTNHVIVAISLKHGVRIQEITIFSQIEYLNAISKRHVFFPFIPKENLDGDKEGGEDLEIKDLYNIDIQSIFCSTN